MKRRMSVRVAAVMLAGVALVNAPAAPAETESRPLEIRLTYGKIAAADMYVFNRGGAGLSFTTKPPAGDWKLPDVGDRQAVFTMIRLGDKGRLAVLDCVIESDAALDSLLSSFGEKAPTAAKFYNRLYFDANANGDLTDDPVIQGSFREGQEDYGHASFALPEATVTALGGVLPYAFSLSVYGPMSTKPEQLRGTLSPMGVYRGRAELMGGTEYTVAIVDANVNGCFGDGMLDLLYLSDHKKIPDRYVLRIASNVVIGSTTYQADFKAATGRLVLTPVKAAATLRLPAGVESLVLQSEPRGNGVAMFLPAPEVSVPQGTYSLLTYQMSRADVKGRLWILSAEGHAKTKRVVTAADATTPVPIGEPFGVEFTCRASRKGSREWISMNFTTVGKDSERVDIPYCLDKASSMLGLNSARQFPRILPRYEVTDSRGVRIAKGRFELG